MGRFDSNKYAKLTNQLVTPTPLNFENAFYVNFLIKANMSKLQKMCDEWFNVPSNFQRQYEPVLPFVMLTFAYYPKAFADEWKAEGKGFLPYKELIVATFVKQKKTFGLMETIGLREINFHGFVPYLFLDHPAPIATGREVYGMPKVVGDVDFPPFNPIMGEPQKFSTSALGFDKSNGEAPMAKKQKIIDITCPDNFNLGELIKQSNGDPTDAIAREFYRNTETDLVDLNLADLMIKVHHMPYLSMRQHRDILNPSKAVEKSIIEFPGRNITLTNGGLLPGPFEIEYGKNSETYPMAESLGLSNEAFMSFWFQWSFKLGSGKNSWSWNKK